MTKKPYPVLAPRSQIPITHLPHHTPSLTPRISLTQRILTPLIVCATLVILLLCVVTGIVLTVKIFGDGHALALVLRVGTGFVVVGSSLTLIYLLLHFSASIQNNPVGFVRPPELKLHAYSFIAARVTLVSWMLSIIVSSVVVSKSSVCVPGTTDCKVQIGGLTLSCVGFVATGIILTALEACQYPFQLPARTNILQDGEINCRVSSFGDDLVDSNLTSLNPSAANILQSHLASASASADSIPSLPDDYLFMGNEREEWEKNYSLALAKERITRETNIKRKPVPAEIAIEEKLPKSESQVSVNSMPGEFPEERERIVPLRPRYTPISEPISTPASAPVLSQEKEKEKEKSKGWGIGWSYLTRDTSANISTTTESNDNEKCVIQSDSAISLGGVPGTGHTTCGTCAHPALKSPGNFISQRIGRQRNVTPSSSIIDASMRSPLSTMRTAESPEIAIKPDVALVPTSVPSSLDRISPRKPPITQPLPIAILNEMMMRRPSVPAPSRMPGGFTKEYIQPPPAHITPLKRKPIESDKILNRPPKSWKDALPVRGGSFEIERKPLASSKGIPSHTSKNPALISKSKQKSAEPRPSLKSWKDSLPIRGGSFEPQRSTANIRDVFPNITRGPLDQNHNHNHNPKPVSPFTTTKPTPLIPKKKTASQKPTHTPQKSPNTAIVIKKHSAEMQVPGAFIEYSKPGTTKERPTSREMKNPGAFIESVPSTPEFEKNQEEETIVQKKPEGVRPLKLRPKGKVLEKEKEKTKEKAKDKVKVEPTEPRNPKQTNITPEIDEPETLYKPAPLGPRPFKRRLFGRANVGTAKNVNEVETAQLWRGMDWARVEPLRKLSLGEMSSGMGNLWDD
ncbi:hypothetical protein BCON_0033g00190 [Botryotinia convoluta]|uniref:Uncharacterized protein n=1 Tax=Botryotinia convoluta TaxID=54673 RepID=A0A4Z1IVV8_9HELO|nr:hypothetical protein BCON_0033g00190 [Botryotinia convoluta]